MKNPIREWFASIVREELRKDRETNTLTVTPKFRVDGPVNAKQLNENVKRAFLRQVL